MNELLSLYENCKLCPRQCGINRLNGETGVCGVSSSLLVSRAALHMWEEPCISGTKGSGTVFFSGCNMHCIFCQNHEISGNHPKNSIIGKEVSIDQLSDLFLSLEEKGANNINLVTPTHYIPSIATALKTAKNNGLSIPVVYNTSGYELVEALALLYGLVDIYLPDFKYYRPETAKNFSFASNYTEITMSAIREMLKQAGEPEFDSKGMMRRGVIVRHLVLPGHINESKQIIECLYNNFKDSIYISLMNQFTPIEANRAICSKYPELLRTVTKREYDKIVSFALDLGIKNGFTQEGKAASESFIPSFNSYEGL